MGKYVMVSREWAESTVGAGPGEPICRSDIELLKAALAAEQHQGEPVVLPQHNRVTVDKPITSDPQGFVDGWNACVAQTAKLGPLYPHADPGEVERLTEQLEVANQTIAYAARQAEEKQKVTDALIADAKQFRGERDTLRAQLAERDALLRDARKLFHSFTELGGMKVGTLYSHAIHMGHRINAALSASAEPSAPTEDDYLPEGIVEAAIHGQIISLPSAPVERDERAAFENWYIHDVGIGLANLSRINSGGRAYEDEDAMAAWEGWQARAALERKP